MRHDPKFNQSFVRSGPRLHFCGSANHVLRIRVEPRLLLSNSKGLETREVESLLRVSAPLVV